MVCYVKRKDVELTVYDSGEVENGKFEIWDGSTVECQELKNEKISEIGTDTSLLLKK